MAEEVKKSRAYYVILFGHLIFIIAWLGAPFWLPWQLVVILSGLLLLQSKYLGYCVITKWQFGTKDRSFWVYYLNKLGLKVTKDTVTRWTRIFLILSPVLAFGWQTLRQ